MVISGIALYTFKLAISVFEGSEKGLKENVKRPSIVYPFSI